MKSDPIRSIQIKILPWIGLWVLFMGLGFLGCTGTPKGSEAPLPREESSLPSARFETSGEQTSEEQNSSLQPTRKEEAPEEKTETREREGEKGGEKESGAGEVRDQVTAQDKTSEVVPKGPSLRISGIFDGFTFSDPNPIVRWNVEPVGTPVRLELYTDPGFTSGNLLWAETTQKDHLQLPKLSEGKEYYLRIGVVQKDTFLQGTLLSYTVSYQPFAVSMLPVVKPGTTVSFTMGYNGGLEREKPEHPVTLTRPYAMGTYEVTNEEYAYVMNRLLKGGILHWEGKNLMGPGGILLAGSERLSFGNQFGFTEKDGLLVPLPGKEKHPVVGVSWYGALAFCYYLSLMEGLEPCVSFDVEDPKNTLTLRLEAEGYRLPTEAEWEYAARGGKNLLYPGGVLNPNGVNFYRSGDPFEGYRTETEAGGPTTPAGYFDGSLRGRYRTVSGAGPFGHFDLLGNVWEWCSDWFDPNYYRNSPQENPSGPGTGSQRVVRGGAWNTQRQDLRLTLRGFFPPEGTSYSIGFRLARTLKAAPEQK